MRLHQIDRVAFALALLVMPACAFGLDLDGFTAAFPPNPCLPNSGDRVVFAGQFCDGAACPPDAWVTCGSAEVAQTNLPGVLNGTRRQVTMYELFNPASNLSARIDAAARRLHVTFDATTEAGVMVDYGTPYDYTQDPDALNLDLLALGVESLRFDLEGDFSPAQPLFVAVEFLSDGPTAPRPSAYATVTVSQDGVVTIPLLAFQPRQPFSMSDVDDIQLWFSQCTDYDNGCSGATYEPVHFSLGPIAFVQGVTPASRSSWGRLKSVYR